jgi:hypothetical protein
VVPFGFLFTHHFPGGDAVMAGSHERRGPTRRRWPMAGSRRAMLATSASWIGRRISSRRRTGRISGWKGGCDGFSGPPTLPCHFHTPRIARLTTTQLLTPRLHHQHRAEIEAAVAVLWTEGCEGSVVDGNGRD